MLYAMEPTEADWYTWYGFAFSVAGLLVGVVGVLASTVGLAATYYQVSQARKSADAARAAAEATSMENKASFRRYLAATIHRQLSELEGFVTSQEWLVAKIRCEDIAGILAQLPEQLLAHEYREFLVFFDSKISDTAKKFGKSKWNKLVIRTKHIVDLQNAPFDISGDSND